MHTKLFNLGLILMTTLLVSCAQGPNSKTLRLGGGDGHGFEINSRKSLKCSSKTLEVVLFQDPSTSELGAEVAYLDSRGPQQIINSVRASKASSYTWFIQEDFRLSVSTISQQAEWSGYFWQTNVKAPVEMSCKETQAGP